MDESKPSDDAHKPAPAERHRKPYAAPQLRPIGAVRDLTLGLTGPNPDFSGGQKH
jgi:hypothetical protein